MPHRMLSGLVVAAVLVVTPPVAAAHSITAEFTELLVEPPGHVFSDRPDAVQISFFAQLDAGETLDFFRIRVFLDGSDPVEDLLHVFATAPAQVLPGTEGKGWRGVAAGVLPSRDPEFELMALLEGVSVDPTLGAQPWDSTDSPIHLGNLVFVGLEDGATGIVRLHYFNHGDLFARHANESVLTYFDEEGRSVLGFTAPGGEFLRLSTGPGVPEPASWQSLGLALAVRAVARRWLAGRALFE